MSIKQEIADRLCEIATLLEEQGAGPFRVNAYQRAAGTVVNFGEPTSEIVVTWVTMPEQGGFPYQLICLVDVIIERWLDMVYGEGGLLQAGARSKLIISTLTV